MRLVHMRFGEIGGIGRHQRQVARIGEIDQRRFGALLDRIAAPCQFDIEPVGEQRLQAVEQGLGMTLLAFGKQPRDRAFARTGEGDQPIGAAIKVADPDVRFKFERAFEMRLRNEMAQIVVPRLVLRVERQVIDLLAFRPLVAAGARHAQQRADDRLHAFGLAGIGEHYRAIKPVTVGDRDSGKAAFLRQLGHRLRIDRPFQHGIGRQDTERDEGLEGHQANMRCGRGFANPRAPRFPPFRHPCEGRDPYNAGTALDVRLSRNLAAQRNQQGKQA